MTSKTENATIFTTEYYNPWAEHCREDIYKVNRWEEEEQKRRIADTLGEQQRRYIANQVAEIVSTTLRPSWFQKGTGYVLRLLGVARKAGDELLHSSQIQTINAKLQIAAQRGIANVSNGIQSAQHKAEDIGHKAQETSQEAKLKLSASLHSFANTVGELGVKAEHTAQEVKHKAGEVKLQEKLGAAQEVAKEKLEKVSEVAKEGLEKVQGVAKRLRTVSLRLISKVNNAFHNISENTNLAFAVLEEESERSSRLLASEWEVYAILNALSVSALIKELGPEFYRPTFEPTRKYSTKLIEDYERSRRVHEDVIDHIAVSNAKSISGLIVDKFSAAALPVSALPAKKELIEEIKVSKAPMTAAM